MLIYDTPDLPASPYDRDRCSLCDAELTAKNCRWAVLPGICLGCAPPGIVHRVNKRSARHRPPPRPPLGWIKRIRLCRCGLKLARRRRMCDACRDAVRRTTARAGMAALRRRRRVLAVKVPHGDGERVVANA